MRIAPRLLLLGWAVPASAQTFDVTATEPASGAMIVPSGLYLVRLEGEGFVLARTVVLAK